MQLGWGEGGGRGWKQTDESLNIYCSNSYVYILVKNSISVGLFVFVYEWTRLFSWKFTHKLQGHIFRFIQFLTWRSLGALQWVWVSNQVWTGGLTISIRPCYNPARTKWGYPIDIAPKVAHVQPCGSFKKRNIQPPSPTLKFEIYEYVNNPEVFRLWLNWMHNFIER